MRSTAVLSAWTSSTRARWDWVDWDTPWADPPVAGRGWGVLARVWAMSLSPSCAHMCPHFPAGSGCGCCPAPMSSTGTVWIPGSCCSRPALSASATSWVRTALAPSRVPADPGAWAGEDLELARLPVPRLSVLLCRELLHGQLTGLRTVQGQTHSCSRDRDGGRGCPASGACCRSRVGVAVPVIVPRLRRGKDSGLYCQV